MVFGAAGSRRPGDAPLFGSVTVKEHTLRAPYTIYDLLLGAFVLFLVVATGMHFMGAKIPASAPPYRAMAPEDVVTGHVPRLLSERRNEDGRWHVNITAVESDPVEKVDITAPGAGGNQPCAEGGADVLPGWVCVKRHRIERRPSITPEELKERYYKQGVPLILTDFVNKEWKVFTEDAWAPEKLKARYGEQTVNVQMGRESDPDFETHQHLLRKNMRFGEYVDMVVDGGESNDYYLTANNHMLKNPSFLGMMQDVEPFFPGFMMQSHHAIGDGTYYWLGPKSTITPLHQDATSLFHVHMKGRKLWRFISPDQKDLVYNSFGVYSDVDLLKPWDEILAKFPKMADATVITEVLQPGEVLFVPNGWFHHVISLDHPTTSMSTTVWLGAFAPLEAHLYKRWNSLYRADQAAGEQRLDQRRIENKVQQFVSAATIPSPAAAKKTSDVVSAAIANFKKSVEKDDSGRAFVAARKTLFETIARDRDATGMLMWVLAQRDYNKVTSEWRNWINLNIARMPPLYTMLEVMAKDMHERSDTEEVIKSWFAFLQSGRTGYIGVPV